MKLVECVPNFSEGRDRAVLDALAGAIRSVEGVRLLDIDPGEATHRTVFTFVGPPEAAAEAAFTAIARAAELIDMRAHRGAHPRMGATDVCPFVPLEGMTMAECVELARKLGERVGRDLGIPVYLYEQAASRPARRALADVRQGEYEGLRDKLRDPDWAPDFGPARFNERSGATAIGAREFLIAYNVNLNTRDQKLATIIAQNIRETGRPRRDAAGQIVRDAGGRAVTEPGPSRLPAVRATGWFIEEYGRAQVSINLTDFRLSPPHAAFEAVDQEARGLGLRATGSELVGLIPAEALRLAGRHYLALQGKSPAAPDAELFRMAVISLGLEELGGFDMDAKIIERRVGATGALAGMTVEGFANEVSSTSPAPGGGSVAALCGALAGALSAMVLALTYERKDQEAARPELGKLGTEAQAIKDRLLRAVDEDAEAFRRYMEAGRAARAARKNAGTDAETAARRAEAERALEAATRATIQVPLSVMKDALRAAEIAQEAMQRGMAAALSDAGVAALAACVAVEGAYYNVRINLSGAASLPDAGPLRAEAERMLARAEDVRRAATARMREKI